MYGVDNVIASDIKRPPKAMLDNGPFVYSDVLDSTQITRLVVEENITCIIHLAAILSATGEMNPHLALRINNEGTQNVLEIARLNQIKIFVPSTIAAFGPSSPKDSAPEECILRPTTMYGVTKVFAELLGEYYNAKFGLDFRSLRYPGVVSAKCLPGGGTTDYAVDIFYAALKHKEYQCFLSEDTALPMIYMPDLLKATVALINAENSSLQRRVYNLGALSFTPKQIAASIRRHVPDFKITYKPDFRQKIADSWPRSVDDSNAAKDWEWKPDYDLDAMVDDVMAILKERLAKENKL